MNAVTTPKILVRGIDLARSGLEKADPSQLALFARSLAHEVLDRAEVPVLESEDSWGQIADAWAQAVSRSAIDGLVVRDVAVSAALDWIASSYPICPTSGLRDLGWDSWYAAIHVLLDIEEGQHEEAVEMLAEMLDAEFEAQSVTRTMDSIPSYATAEMSFVPYWDGQDRDQLVGDFGLNYSSPKMSISSIVKDSNFARMLSIFNVSIPEMMAAVAEFRHDELEDFTESIKTLPPVMAAYLQAEDQSLPKLMTAKDVITVVENAAQHAVPNISFQVRLRDLLAQDPGRPIVLESQNGKFHIGAHDGMMNGAGYMDSFKPTGPLCIDLTRGSVFSDKRWNATLHDVYYHRKSAYKVSLRQESGDQIEVARLLERVSRG